MKFVIIHFQPIEKYPPVLNLIEFLKSNGAEIFVFTTKCSLNVSFYNPENKKVKVFRFSEIKDTQGRAQRLFTYLLIYIRIFLKLLKIRPKKILYYETISALPVLVFKEFYRSTKVFVHYHEYVTPEEYKSGMVITKLVHKYEKVRFQKFNWISHTNQVRLDKFLSDQNFNNIKYYKGLKFQVFPNYPPVGWGKQKLNRDSKVLKLVYVGYSLDFETMFAKELFEWIVAKEGQMVLDCYLFKENNQVADFIRNVRPRNIMIKGKIDYFELPLVLPNYDVGLILYKGHIENYIHNAPNKLFEYLACGLDVWFPNEMLGCYPYITTEEYPKVVKVDFNNLKEEMVERLISKDGLIKKTNTFNCEQVILPLKDELLRF